MWTGQKTHISFLSVIILMSVPYIYIDGARIDVVGEIIVLKWKNEGERIAFMAVITSHENADFRRFGYHESARVGREMKFYPLLSFNSCSVFYFSL
jgi:hypothetical protein